MSEQKKGHSRRDFLLKTITLAPAMAVGSTAMGALSLPLAAQAAETPAGPQQARDYQPAWFTAEEFAFITAAVARLIPCDERGPGALEAGVPEFIDRQMNTPYATGSNWYMQGPFNPDLPKELGYQLPLVPQQIYRLGLADADSYSKKQHGKVFAQLSGEQQDALLQAMESGSAEFSQLPAKVFFSFLLQNTREGFFSDPIHGGNQGMVGWKLINFPGARADFMDWVERGERYPFPSVSIRGERS
ncbi:gluconate 2-dehydrogenase subunit 3 family protein [Pantoea sp. Bo_2]|uniref:Gluconate 2-dehydrogenase subunit 3 family protein n=1 Tax=Candidatus Pantoea gossypiicola TaxID=2608008 RepID=A0AB34CGB5_9GAMM|nr:MULTISPECIES: gluconate 2-dehydrogenase subunit 3 family protein [Pantoea]KAA5928209.1 gluconate 2-dehydrogenase subunit 3 family protein [Pantoea sp. VH_8]KAA5933289.1 gluconate 2-dehydrogenase subunit 3 family protein [Pantoea sp. VH_4]KAA5947981.1 gluconate 2-dehydrogenase subunit 3 family protein [Pantoea sp. VH_3]KAA5952618.1 gluconate 2-dehydrogenase subunit 3 family protein [Pantoea sp. VH_25]KAA5958354.1 gluconate 2-dehydrogenase subunit 3 family protein [Pantoea sp. VH_24]